MPKSLAIFSKPAKFFERILNSLTTGIFVCGNEESNYIVHFINDAYACYLGVPREEILGRPITDFIPDTRAPFVTSTGLAEMGDLRTLKGANGERFIIVNRLPFKDDHHTVGMLSQTLFGSREEFDVVIKRVEYLDKKIASDARRIKSALSPHYTLSSIQGESKAIRQFREHLVRCAQADSPVLVCGATGTGKELAANALHCESSRHDGPFVSINCAAIPKELFESELFGYAPGAFSGAHKDGKVGQIELADRGTLFLDEIGDTPLPAQAKLLRVLENRTLHRLGSSQPRTVDFRLVAATNRDINAMI
ncbi:MAG: sigma 54-interacting transcriptional regulator, partial [Deltaproteobacteria bacterium]|nr:sigma 54-interacting transcriptional regulator [Deltaproteobacteria bacterium]